MGYVEDAEYVDELCANLSDHVDDETNMKELEKNVRAIEMDGLQWGASKLVPVGYGISKLQVNLVVEDEKVSIDDLQAQIEGDEDHVQSTDVVSNSGSCVLSYTLIVTYLIVCYAKAIDTLYIFPAGRRHVERNTEMSLGRL